MNVLKTYFAGKIFAKEIFAREIETWIVRFLPFIIRRSLKRGLHAVWQSGRWNDLPTTGAVLAVNHHSWWDAYLCWLVQQELPIPVSGMMGAEQLERFRFFRRIGVISDSDVREALRRLERGDLLFIFPEGELRGAGGVKDLNRGVSFLARRAGVPTYPVAFRVVMRGAQYPEAFVVLGDRLEPKEDDQSTLASLENAMNTLLSELDQHIAATPPEEEPFGLDAWLKGKESVSTRMAWVRRLWA